VPRAHDLRFFTWSSDRAVDACRWRAQQLRGPPALRSLERACSRAGLPGATVGVLDTGVSRSTCSWAPSSAHHQPRGESTTRATEKTLVRRRLTRRTTAKTAKDQKTSSRAPAGEGRDHVRVSSARWRAEQEDKGQKTAYRPRYPRQGGDQLSLCLPKAAQWLLATPLKIAWMVQGARGRRQLPPPTLVDRRHYSTKTTSTEDCSLQLSTLLSRVWQPLPQEDKGKEDLGAIKGGEATP
jgi:hypothetical protein